MRRLQVAPHAADAVSELATRDRATSTLGDHDTRWARWVEWCKVNHTRPLPATSDAVLAFLHAQHPYWGPDTLRAAADSVSQAHIACGYPDPTDGVVSRYLAAAARAFAGRGDPQRVDAIRPDDLARMCAAPSSAGERRRASAARQLIALAVARHEQMPLRDLGDAGIRVDTAGVGLRLRDGRVVRPPSDLRAVAETACAELTDLGVSTLQPSGALLSAVRSTLSRAGMAGDSERVRTLPSEDFEWVLNWTDSTFATDLRDRTIAVVGVALARRGIEMTAFDITDFTLDTVGGGRDVLIRRSKTDPEGRGIAHYLDHDNHDSDAWCPVCSLDVWLYVLRRRWNHTEGPLFPVLKNAASGQLDRRLSRAYVSSRLKLLWSHSSGDPSARIASRSLRVGGASSAREAGLAPQEVAREVTKHACLDTTARYIRPRRGGVPFRLDA